MLHNYPISQNFVFLFLKMLYNIIENIDLITTLDLSPHINVFTYSKILSTVSLFLNYYRH